MKYAANVIASFLLIIPSFTIQAQSTSILQQQWKASWIAVPSESPTEYGVYLFRKKFDIGFRPRSFMVHVSADNRYKLFVNEKLVSLGPARGDIFHWNFETVDIAPYLQTGENLVAAQVWNESDWRPEGQISFRTGFILQGASAAEHIINSDNTWKCIKDSSYTPLKVSLATYYVAGPGEQIDMSLHIKDWAKVSLQDDNWKNAKVISPGMPKNFVGPYGTVSGWMLVPSAIPAMELTEQRLVNLRKADGVKISTGFPAVKTAVTIAPNTVATILLDQSFLTNAYPTIIFSGGKRGAFSVSYAEALYSPYPDKGNRNDIEDKTFIGRKDSIISDGSSGQVFTTLSWRTYRYLQIIVTTEEAPLVLEDIYGTFTGYPFKYNARLRPENAELNKILEIGWRTARLCAVETYMDCPYYEQLQYIGDARIQGLVSLYNSGDDRLLRNALNQMDNSRQPEGVTLSRHPSYTPQYIPTFSLWYIGMLHDYLMYGKDVNFLKNKLPGARQVLGYFDSFRQQDGSLKNVPHWMFTDWVDAEGWKQGIAPTGEEGASAAADLQLLWAYELAEDMENKIGMKAYASLYKGYVAQLKKTIKAKYWDKRKQLFSDRPEKDMFSQHTNALAILTKIVDHNEALALGRRLLADTSLAPASIYFKYYLHQALINAGYGNSYLNWLGKWRENMDSGLTTWSEMSDVNRSRSDCHAWGASPNIEIFRTVLGIDSEAPGFAKIKIEPHLGALTSISGEMPHPHGTIAVSYRKEHDKWNVSIALPLATTGHFLWNGKFYQLKGGVNKFSF